MNQSIRDSDNPIVLQKVDQQINPNRYNLRKSDDESKIDMSITDDKSQKVKKHNEVPQLKVVTKETYDDEPMRLVSFAAV